MSENVVDRDDSEDDRRIGSAYIYSPGEKFRKVPYAEVKDMEFGEGTGIAHLFTVLLRTKESFEGIALDTFFTTGERGSSASKGFVPRIDGGALLVEDTEGNLVIWYGPHSWLELSPGDEVRLSRN